MMNCFLGKSIEKMKLGSWEQIWTVYIKVLFLYHTLHLFLFVTCSSYLLLHYSHSKLSSLKQQICLNSHFFCLQIWNVSQWQHLIPASCSSRWGRGASSTGFPHWGWNHLKVHHSHIQGRWRLGDEWDFSYSFRPEHLYAVLPVSVWFSDSVRADIGERTSQENNVNIRDIFMTLFLKSQIITHLCFIC